MDNIRCVIELKDGFGDTVCKPGDIVDIISDYGGEMIQYTDSKGKYSEVFLDAETILRHFVLESITYGRGPGCNSLIYIPKGAGPHKHMLIYLC